jgi:hypothetical protein
MITIFRLPTESVSVADLTGFTNMFNNSLPADKYRFTNDQVITVPANKSMVIRFECSNRVRYSIEASNNNFASESNWNFKTLYSEDLHATYGPIVHSVVSGPEDWKLRFVVQNLATTPVRAFVSVPSPYAGNAPQLVEYDKPLSIAQAVRLDYQIRG